jgi:predicted ArsR family transcriptional regulator
MRRMNVIDLDIRQPPPAAWSAGANGRAWTFLTNHAHVLVALAADPTQRVRDVAVRVGITERAAQRILHDLVAAGYLERDRHGRRNAYRLVLDRPMRHPVEAGHTVGDLVAALRAAT